MAYRGKDPKEAVGDIASWLEERHSQGLSITSVVHLFNHLPGNQSSRIIQMQREVENVFDMVCRRLDNILFPVRAYDVIKLCVVCPDYPVPKNKKKPIRDVTVNDGLHMNALYLHNPSIDSLLTEVLKEHEKLYVNPLSKICRFKPILLTETPKRGVKYDLKSISRRRVTLDDILILPRLASEQVPWSRLECWDRLKDSPKSKGTGEGSRKESRKGMPLRAKGRRDSHFADLSTGERLSVLLNCCCSKG